MDALLLSRGKYFKGVDRKEELLSGLEAPLDEAIEEKGILAPQSVVSPSLPNPPWTYLSREDRLEIGRRRVGKECQY